MNLFPFGYLMYIFLPNITLQAVTTMEKPPFRQNQNCGDWELKEKLGVGGFAHVYLYQHRVSLEHCSHGVGALNLANEPNNRCLYFYGATSTRQTLKVLSVL